MCVCVCVCVCVCLYMQQYLPCLERANFSNNSIGPTPSHSPSSLTGSLNGVEQSVTASVAPVGVANGVASIATVSVSSANGTTVNYIYTEGIEVCVFEADESILLNLLWLRLGAGKQ